MSNGTNGNGDAIQIAVGVVGIGVAIAIAVGVGINWQSGLAVGLGTGLYAVLFARRLLQHSPAHLTLGHRQRTGDLAWGYIGLGAVVVGAFFLPRATTSGMVGLMLALAAIEGLGVFSVLRSLDRLHRSG